MTDERTRWSDERLDDFASGVSEDLAEIKSGVKQLQTDELQRLRDRATRAESEVRSTRKEFSGDTKALRIRRIGYAFAVGSAVLAATMGALVGALIAHAL